MNTIPKNRWLTLSIYNNCFEDGSLEHLGIKFKGVNYCVTHSEGNGILIPKECLKMKNKSDRFEYFKKCTSKPNFISKTGMRISEAFIVSSILNSVLNKIK